MKSPDSDIPRIERGRFTAIIQDEREVRLRRTLTDRGWSQLPPPPKGEKRDRFDEDTWFKTFCATRNGKPWALKHALSFRALASYRFEVGEILDDIETKCRARLDAGESGERLPQPEHRESAP